MKSDAQAPLQPAKSNFPRALRKNRWSLLLLPGAIFLLVFFVAPLSTIVYRSFSDPQLSLQNYRIFFDSPLYSRVLWRTTWVSGLITIICFALGYPYAYFMAATRRPLIRGLLLFFILLPFWTSLLVRTIAWMTILRDTGVINQYLIAWGIIEQPLPLIRNLTGVIIGMTQILLPFMVIPLYASMRSIDQRLVKAALSLGARPSIAFLRVFFPLSIPGIVAGALLVYVLSLGFYITPALLGSPSDMMIGQLIVQQVRQILNWGVGGALSVGLLLITGAILAVLAWIGKGKSGVGAIR